MLKRPALSLAAIVLLVLAFCGVSVLSLIELRRDRWEQAMEGSTNLLNALSQDISRNVRSYDLSLQAVAARYQNPTISRLSPELQQAVLFDGSSAADYLGSILILDAEGNVLKDAGRLPPRQDNFQDRLYFQVHRDDPGLGLHVSPPFVRRMTGTDRVIALSRRMNGPDGSFAGVVVGTMRLSFFQDLFDRAHLGPDDSLTLSLKPGTLVLRSPFREDAVGRDLSTGENMRRIMAAPSGTFAGVAAIDGIRKVFNFRHVGGTPLVLTLALSEDAIFAPWRSRAAMIGGMLVLCCVLTLALGLFRHREADRRREAEAVLRESEAQYRLLADHATDVIMKLDGQLRRRYVSPACLPVLGYAPEELRNRRVRDIIHPEDWPTVERMVRAAQTAGGVAEATYRLRHGDGRHVWIEGRYRYVAADDAFIVVLRDVSQRRETERLLESANRELAALASTDALTGLANRRSFDEAIRAELRRDDRQGLATSLLLIDVDRFKSFNDRYGHPAGDGCLRAIAAAIGAAARRPGDLAARYGGEEFAVVLPGTDEDGARSVAERIRADVEALAIAHAGNAAHGGRATISIGCATARSAEGEDAPAALIAQADRQLYEAKRLGRNRVGAPASPTAPPSAGDGAGDDETARLRVVASYQRFGLLDPSTEFDRLARSAAELMGTGYGLVTRVDRDEVVVLGAHNVEVVAMPRAASCCGHVIQGTMPFVVPDARVDRRFRDLAWAQNGPCFYAGVPLIDPQTDLRLGTLCVLDARAGALDDPAHLRRLQTLAGELSADLARRRAMRGEDAA